MAEPKNRILRKLRSDKGASITFGLLLFLVCAIISSVVLVAGTGAAGRMSGMSQTEQRYYSVNSTAKLITEELKDASATIIKIGDKQYLVSGSNLKEITGDPASAISSLPEYIAYKTGGFDGSGGTFDLELDMKQLDPDATDVSMNAAVSSDDKLSIKIDNDDYNMTLVFSTNKKTMPVDISSDEGTSSGEKTVYSWTLSSASGK